jgi:hypothetical protein
VGVGALFGLTNYRYDVVGILMHAEHLEARFGVGPHTISVPRIRPADDIDPADFPDAVTDEVFRRIVAVLRIAVPYTGMIVSTRESKRSRELVLDVGVSQLSGGSKTSVGGYADVKLTDGDADGIYECGVPAGMEKVIFCRMNPDFAEFGWNTGEESENDPKHVWNQTADLEIGVEPNNYYHIVGWDNGAWGTKDYYELPVTPASNIGLVGSFQGWDVAAPIAMESLNGGWIVARSIELYKTDEFKFVEGNTWDVSYGNSTTKLYAEANMEYQLTSDGGQNISVMGNGKFDIYFNVDSKMFKYECVEDYANITVDITINNKANWSPLYIYLEYEGTAITPAEGALVENGVYTISGSYIGCSLTCKFISGSKVSEVQTISIGKTGTIVTLEETVIKLFVQLDTDNSKQWWGDTMKIHVWETGTSFDTSWPGTTMTNEGNYTWSVIVPSELVGKTIKYLVHNGNGWQSKDSTITIQSTDMTVKGSSIGVN